MKKNKIKQRMINWNIPITPHKDSDGEIGVFFMTFKVADIIHGEYYFGLYFGRYMLSYSPTEKWQFCRYFATGCGG